MSEAILQELKQALAQTPLASKQQLYDCITDKQQLSNLTFGEAATIDEELFHFGVANTHWTKPFNLPEEGQVVDDDEDWVARDVGVFTFKLKCK
jgi:hypothetical protein